MAAPVSVPICLNFMLEEQSAQDFLEVLLPKILPSWVSFRCIPHQGKGDLQKSIPVKLKDWRNPNDFFVIVHDQDNSDCLALKQELRGLCKVVKYHVPLIRIVCRELEAWYFGDLAAVKKAFPEFPAAKLASNRDFHDPDQITKPSAVLNETIKEFNKTTAAGKISKHMNPDPTANKSESFKHFVIGVKKFAEDCLRARNP
ncbi:MAG: DUF4276 family protein [Alphaproteobacteria bacterium]|nr:DUF4276 family protein [Alphaproteobacteria bacterium]